MPPKSSLDVLQELNNSLEQFFFFNFQVPYDPRAFLFFLQRRNFIQYAKVFPGSRLLGMTIDPKLYRLAVGWYEVVCGTILVLVPGRVKQASNCALLVLMLGAVYTHAALKDRFERMAPSIVFVLMLVCRLVVFYQVQSREKARVPEAARPKAD
ncbi:transmembrane protein, putative [Ixodes scapularis]|uniref:Novel acetylcholine receptor chaperone n=1 Tax=Ixodes scapularis TaxID=6945 RepID=B7QCM1_IXOSC|nr:transmembrane protein, putative [Ixodes scapularis]|eukprot:XP_002413285.1 transmembrane protein, putative [Ixodes scapularis]